MDELEQRLTALITQVRQHPPHSRNWRFAMARLLREIPQLPRLARSSHPHYPDALNLTLEWVSKRISEFEPYSDSLLESFVKWINGYLSWRIIDLYSPDRDAPLSLDAPIEVDAGETTLLDRLADPTLSGLDGLIENALRETTQRIGLELELYIEQDSEGRLKNCYPRSSPECNCQLLSQKLVLKNPPEKFADVAREFNIPYTTVNSHWKRKCEPLLQEIACNLGYRQEQ